MSDGFARRMGRFSPVILPLLIAVFYVGVTGAPAQAFYDTDYGHSDGASLPAPPDLETLEDIKPVHTPKNKKKDTGLPINIRADAVREGALSFGARSGLAWRTYHIQKEMKSRTDYLTKVFDFRNLLIAAPSGLLIEPPVITEQQNALIIEGSGAIAAVADRIFEINQNAKIVSSARHWRNYLEREWGDVPPPPDILLPQDEEERREWIKWLRIGWARGLEQADEIFEADLNQLTADYQGMVRYRMLLAQGMVSPPYATQVDRGVTGGGNMMRVGDREVQITGMPALKTGARTWQPANR